MSTLGDRAVGLLLFLVSTALFVYYTLWVVVTPFVDDSHVIQQWFPARELAITVPSVFLVVAGSVVVSFIALVMIKSGKK